ncbi:MAG: hypothetical protein HC877_18835 [Thioploca sp.]|nr:hypothetical protein [Thioploca sp.]
MRKAWLSPVPEKCQLCRYKIIDEFYDVNTFGMGWAIVCNACFHIEGFKLGVGFGQHYKLDKKEKTFLRVR